MISAIAQSVATTDLSNYNIGLHSGQAGIALYLAYHARYTGETHYLDRSMEILQHCFSKIEEEGTVYSLCSGIAGTTWTLAHLSRHAYFDANLPELLTELDDFLLEITLEAIAEGDYDLLHSGLGVGVYFLERWTAGDRRNLLPRMVRALAQQRVYDGEWRSWLDTISPSDSDRTFNLGMAHGVPSIVGFLAECLAAKVPVTGLAEMLEETVHWLLQQELPPGGVSCFANCIIAGQPDRKESRLAWCYGDLGIAAALHRAGVVMNRPPWQQTALRILQKAAQRPLPESKVQDACFCHGSAGNAFIFQKYHRLTGDPSLLKAANFWYDDLRSRRTADTPSGFLFWTVPPEGGTTTDWRQDASLLNGLAGVGMALLAEQFGMDTDWDRCFLLG